VDLNPKRIVTRAMARVPVHHALPPGSVRTYAALRYLSENGTTADVAEYVRRNGAPQSRLPSTATIAAMGALRSGQDDVLERILEDATSRFPDAAEVLRIKAAWMGYLGRHEDALEVIGAARMLEPTSSTVAAEQVRLSYLVLEEDDADAVALAALPRFADRANVLWAVSKECRTAEQYERIVEAWLSNAKDPEDVPKAVRQLATAAGRAGLTEEAIGWHLRALERLNEGSSTTAAVGETQLKGKGAWTAIEDLTRVLDDAEVPFFFAAGTALGLVREGRPLSLDADIDVGIRDEHYDLEALRELFRTHPSFEFDVVHPRTHKLGLRHRGGSPVDLFRFYDEDGHTYHDAVFTRWRNRPFDVQRIEVQGLQVPIPADEDHYLTENYGDWRTPNPAFDAFTDDAPNVEVTWPEYHRLHLVRRAYRSFTNGDVATAARFLRAADEPAWADRIEATHG
jgi:tetratricopeptide (TPR) repeat protein